MSKRKTLPSTKLLDAFTTVARCGSFTLAAESLNLTQSAISKQIQQLEQQLGQTLFHREHNQLILTSAGQQYLPAVSEALEIIEQASVSLIQADAEKRVISIDASPSFANLWLMTALTRFKHHDIQLRLQTGDNTLPASASLHHHADIVIRCLPLADHYSNAELLCEESLTLVADAKQMKDARLQSPLELLNYAWLPQITRPNQWHALKDQYDIVGEEQYALIGFEHFYLALTATCDRPCLALLPSFMIQQRIDAGTLINPFSAAMKSGFGYYLFCTPRKRQQGHIEDFIRWMKISLQT
ncbi:LysR family transcriptional regulator [Thaumasiovibrio subtropicus]|uniref:LysR family transcriptional regulator n=1 Tax=Thaumasiovibrio subtropicus TaxID=1891207 RepID=UPI000B351CF6|nr:LysR family transcriptional regulator [Thaumasiovibrio subtropicus]